MEQTCGGAAGRAGSEKITQTNAGSNDCEVLQLYPALQAVQDPFPEGLSPDLLQGVPWSALPGQQSPACTVWPDALIWSWQLLCVTPASP